MAMVMPMVSMFYDLCMHNKYDIVPLMLMTAKYKNSVEVDVRV
jgi:hypothetical protein